MNGRTLWAKMREMAIPVLAAGMLLLAIVALPGSAGATVISASPIDFAAPEQSVFNGAVATFTDDNPSAGPADFTTTIDWGDGTPTTVGTLGFSSDAFVVLGQHTYADEGTFTLTVTISDVSPGTGTATVHPTGTINEADVLSGTGTSFSAPSGVSFTTTAATFHDSLTSAAAADFTATIDWGDATTSGGTITGGGGSFQVSGTHTYASTGTFTVSVTLADDAPGAATATATSTAHVAGSGVAVTGTNVSAQEGMAFNGTVATFSDSDTSKTAASFTSTIAWGDGTTTAGTITGSSGSFTVSGQHTYADEGSFTTTVTVTEIGPGGATGSGSGTATVADTDVLSGTPGTVSAQAATSFTGIVATFTDTNTTNVASDFAATIDWGDGTTSAGTVAGGGGTFNVSGTHTYAAAGTFTVTVTLADDAPGTATATAASTANVTAGVVTIPTLDLRGLLALGLALLGAAFSVMKTRRPRRHVG
jgi:hypothetical protein